MEIGSYDLVVFLGGGIAQEDATSRLRRILIGGVELKSREILTLENFKVGLLR